MCSSPSLSETKGVGHTLPRRDGLTGFAQELLPLRSRLTSPRGDQLTTPQGGLTHIVSALVTLNSPTHGGPYSDRAHCQHRGYSHQDDYSPWKRRGFEVLLLTYYWPNAGVHHICGGEGHMAVLAHMAALAGSSRSVTPRRSLVVTPQHWPYQLP